MELQTQYDFRKLNNIYNIASTNVDEAEVEHADGIVFNIIPSASINTSLLRVDSVSSSLQVSSIIR